MMREPSSRSHAPAWERKTQPLRGAALSTGTTLIQVAKDAGASCYCVPTRERGNEVVKFLACVALYFAVSMRPCIALEIVGDIAGGVPVMQVQPAEFPTLGEAVFMPSLAGSPLLGLSDFATQTVLIQELKKQEWKSFPLVQVDPQVLAMEQQLRPQYETQLNAKLHHWRSVCRPTLEQQEKLLAAGKASLDKSLRAMAEQQVKMQGGGEWGNAQVVFNGPQSVVTDPTSAIANALNSVAKEVFTDGQRTKLKREAKERKQFEKRVGVRNLIVLLDKRLILSKSQRTTLMTKLDEGWQQQWMNHIQNLIHGSESIPQIPDKLIKPLLNERQQKIWKDLQKNQHNHFFGGMHMFHNVPQMEAFEPKELEPEG